VPGTPAAQVQGPLLDVLPGREDLLGGHLPGDHPGVAGVFAEPADVRVLAGFFLAAAGGGRRAAGGVGIELEDQPVRGVPQLAERLGLGRLG
jgi:hypothetical protein